VAELVVAEQVVVVVEAAVAPSGSNLTFESGRDSRLARCMQVWRMRTGISIFLV
jgi:hypothetical protein